MSYDFYAVCPRCKRTVEFDEPHQKKGGTYAIGGEYEAHLNITYNYSKHFNFRELEGVPVSDSLQTLREAVSRLGTERAEDYWDPTEGNVGEACQNLLWVGEAAVKEDPECVWRIT